jgi:hypothetical protein
VNFTLTSNGTVYFDGNGLKSGWWFQKILNCTFANARIEHSNGEFILQRWARYCRYENLTGFSWNEGAYANAGFNNNQVQHCTFYNIIIDGNNVANTRGAVYMGDWEQTSGWDGTCFNNWTKIWIKNVKRTGFYLNSGALGNQVYNNTFTNCTIENNWEAAYNAIKLRPAINSTFTQIVIRNWTDPITTGTAYADGECGNGNTTGNHVQADITGATVTGLILCADDNNQEVSNNFFNLTFQNSKGIYVAFGTNSPVKNNVIYANFTNCNYGIRLEEGPMRDNTFYLNFSNCDGDGHADIYHYSTWTEITDNTFKVYGTSGNSYGLMDFTNGTQGNIVLYPYTGTTETEVNVVIALPANTTYTTPTVPIEIYAYGGTIHKIIWNCTFTNGTVVYANTVYTTPTSMTLGDGNYIFNARANNTDGTVGYSTVMFTVLIVVVSGSYGSWWGDWW